MMPAGAGGEQGSSRKPSGDRPLRRTSTVFLHGHLEFPDVFRVARARPLAGGADTAACCRPARRRSTAREGRNCSSGSPPVNVTYQNAREALSRTRVSAAARRMLFGSARYDDPSRRRAARAARPSAHGDRGRPACKVHARRPMRPTGALGSLYDFHRSAQGSAWITSPVGGHAAWRTCARRHDPRAGPRDRVRSRRPADWRRRPGVHVDARTRTPSINPHTGATCLPSTGAGDAAPHRRRSTPRACPV